MSGDEGLWKLNSRQTGTVGQRITVYNDELHLPDESEYTYEWIKIPDQVRVAAFVRGQLLVIEQTHYLIGSSYQLPGGTVETGYSAEEAAREELRQETGYVGGRWVSEGYIHPLPSATVAKVHLFSVRGLEPGPTEREPMEADIKVHHLSLPQATRAIASSRLTCAGSVVLIQRLALARPTRRRRPHR